MLPVLSFSRKATNQYQSGARSYGSTIVEWNSFLFCGDFDYHMPYVKSKLTVSTVYSTFLVLMTTDLLISCWQLYLLSHSCPNMPCVHIHFGKMFLLWQKRKQKIFSAGLLCLRNWDTLWIKWLFCSSSSIFSSILLHSIQKHFLIN